MTPTRPTSFRLEEELLDALQQVQDRDGIPVTEQVRRALHAWLDAKGVSLKKTERQRAGTRERSSTRNRR